MLQLCSSKPEVLIMCSCILRFKLYLCIRSILVLHGYAIYKMLLFCLFYKVQHYFLLIGVRHCSGLVCMN